MNTCLSIYKVTQELYNAFVFHFTIHLVTLKICLFFRCQCGNCRVMRNLRESKCCQTTNVVDGRLEGLACITEHEGFRVNCLNPHVLEVAYYDHVLQEGPREEHQRIHR